MREETAALYKQSSSKWTLFIQLTVLSLQSGQTGSAWQRAWVAKHGDDMAAMTAAYLKRQDGGQPVHEWDLGT